MKCVELEYQTETLAFDPEHKPYLYPMRLVLTAFFLLLIMYSFWKGFKIEFLNAVGSLPWVEIALKSLVGLLSALVSVSQMMKYSQKKLHEKYIGGLR